MGTLCDKATCGHWHMAQEEPLACTEPRIRPGSAHRGAGRTLYDLVRVTMHGATLQGLGVQFSWEPLFLSLEGVLPVPEAS